jgi:hypothetical protein
MQKNKNTNEMETLIVKLNGNESIKANLKFRILTNGTRYDMFIYETYSEAKCRLEKLKRILKHSSHEILVIE